MKIHHAALWVLLSACCHVDAYQPPDASAPDASTADAISDAPPDASRRMSEDCMGNLPNSRSVNVDDSDPVPSGLLDEIQDVLIADSYKARPTSIGGAAFKIQIGAPALVDQEWTFSTSVTGALCADLSLPVGTNIERLEFDIKRNSANGHGVFLMRLVKFNMGAGTNINVFAFTQSAGSPYARIDIVQGSTYQIQDNATYLLKIETDASVAFDAAPKFDGVRMVLSR